MRPEMRTVEGHFACGAGFLVSTDCLSQSYGTTLGDHTLTVTLPSLNPTYPLDDLIAPWVYPTEDNAEPEGKDSEHTGRGDGMWGSIARWSDDPEIPEVLAAHVTRCSFTMTAFAKDEDELMDLLGQTAPTFDDWWLRLSDWIELITEQNLVAFGKQRATYAGDRLTIWTTNPDGTRSGVFSSISWGDIRELVGNPLSSDQLSACMSLAGSRKRPPDPWLFIRDARSLLDAAEYRRAIIDAGTAAELAMTTLLDQRLSSSDAVVREALLKRYETLRGRGDLVKKLGAGSLPHRLQQDLIEPRNTANHRGVTQTVDGARAAIDLATELVDQAYPLSRMMSRSE